MSVCLHLWMCVQGDFRSQGQGQTTSAGDWGGPQTGELEASHSPATDSSTCGRQEITVSSSPSSTCGRQEITVSSSPSSTCGRQEVTVSGPPFSFHAWEGSDGLLLVFVLSFTFIISFLSRGEEAQTVKERTHSLPSLEDEKKTVSLSPPSFHSHSWESQCVEDKKQLSTSSRFHSVSTPLPHSLLPMEEREKLLVRAVLHLCSRPALITACHLWKTGHNFKCLSIFIPSPFSSVCYLWKMRNN